VDTRPKESLGTPKPLIRSFNDTLEMLKVSGDTVGHMSFEICPDPFIGIKFRRIPRKVDGLDSGMPPEESLREPGFVKSASVPEEKKRASDLAAKAPEELPDLLTSDVLVGIESSVEVESLSLG
jgi:hypothetical protein